MFENAKSRCHNLSIAKSDEIEGVSVISGTVYDQDRITPASNVNVVLFAWPNSDEMESLLEGESFERIPLGICTSGKDGSYYLKIDPEVNLDSIWSKFGTIDCELLAVNDKKYNSFSFSLMKEYSGIDKNHLSADAAYIDISNGNVFQGIIVDVSLISRPDTNSKEVLSGGEYLIETYPAQWVNVGHVLIKSNSITGKYTFSYGASTTIGAAISTSGDYGTYSASGTVSRGATSTVSFPQFSDVKLRYMDTQFVFSKYRCYFGFWYYCVRASGFAGGAQISRLCSVPSGGYVTSYVAGSSFTRDSATANTESYGARVASIIGINLSSRSGYTSSSKLTYTFSQNGYVFGENNYPPLTTGRIWASIYD